VEIDVYEKFKKKFSVSQSIATDYNKSVSGGYEPHLRELFQQFGGVSFNAGLYRVATCEVAPVWSEAMNVAFPSGGKPRTCFGFDWLGRIFALEHERLVDGLPGVVMLEPGTGQALEIPCNVHSFHEAELIEYCEEALAASFFDKWTSHGCEVPKFHQCVGYKSPLFLGGADVIENLELSDMDVYWTICSQLIEKARKLPIGSRVSEAHIG
jgi:hypothetical protein